MTDIVRDYVRIVFYPSLVVRWAMPTLLNLI